MDTLTNLLLQIIVGTVIAVVASWTTVRLSLKRFVSEKSWEKRVEAYIAILESLHYMKRDFDEDIEAARAGREVSEDRKEVSRQKYREAHDELNKRIDVWQFILSDKAGVTVSTLKLDLRKASSENLDNWIGYIVDSQSSLDVALGEMRIIAKDDLKDRWG